MTGLYLAPMQHTWPRPRLPPFFCTPAIIKHLLLFLFFFLGELRQQRPRGVDASGGRVGGDKDIDIWPQVFSVADVLEHCAL